eukprot:2274190-Rhodomonas_salina.1
MRRLAADGGPRGGGGLRPFAQQSREDRAARRPPRPPGPGPAPTCHCNLNMNLKLPVNLNGCSMWMRSVRCTR